MAASMSSLMNPPHSSSSGIVRKGSGPANEVMRDGTELKGGKDDG